MAGKVIHVPDEAHAKAKSYCEENKIRMSEWMRGLVESALNGNGSGPARVVVKEVIKEIEVIKEVPVEKIVEKIVEVEKVVVLVERHEPIEKKAFTAMRTAKDDELYSRPPFWANEDEKVPKASE